MAKAKKAAKQPPIGAQQARARYGKVPFECIALLLQGGGALGAYQAGVYQALTEKGIEPTWVAGISIGAINAAIIAGNAPEMRLNKLREFWNLVTNDASPLYPSAFKSFIMRNDSEHQALNAVSAINTVMQGIPGFFRPRIPGVTGVWNTNPLTQTSFYETAELKRTLERLIDFDRLNADEIHCNVGAVNVRSGNFVSFDNYHMDLTPEHIMASGALPPAFPPVEIDGEHYWDGGLISNTPLEWLVDSTFYHDSLVFQVDLWSADGEFPQNMLDVYTRQKDIQYSSRTRANTDRFREAHRARYNIAAFLDQLPERYKQSPEALKLLKDADRKVYNIVHLIYHNKPYEGYSKDFEFSRMSMEAHWQSGYEDTLATLKHPQVLQRPHNKDGIAIFDFSNDRR
jgi:NTE family protein